MWSFDIWFWSGARRRMFRLDFFTINRRFSKSLGIASSVSSYVAYRLKSPPKSRQTVISIRELTSRIHGKVAPSLPAACPPPRSPPSTAHLLSHQPPSRKQSTPRPLPRQGARASPLCGPRSQRRRDKSPPRSRSTESWSPRCSGPCVRPPRRCRPQGTRLGPLEAGRIGQ